MLIFHSDGVHLSCLQVVDCSFYGLHNAHGGAKFGSQIGSLDLWFGPGLLLATFLDKTMTMEKIRRYRGIIAATTTTLVATVVIVLVGCARSQIPLRPVSTIPNPSGQVTELPMIAETEVAAMPMTTPGAPDEAAEPSHSLRLLTPPMVIYQSPFRLFRFITELPSISVTFSKIVTGLMASDLTVNGSPATSITGSGEGPYVFTGFESPALGPITVTVAPGDIQGVGGEAFEGTSWTHTLIDPALDSDGDGVNDGEEVNTHFTDPTNPDTDGDPI